MKITDTEKSSVIRGVKVRLALSGRAQKNRQYKADLRWTKVIEDDEIYIHGAIDGFKAGDDVKVDIVNVMDLSGRMRRRYAINARHPGAE